jgi:acetyl-CoA synthetase
VRGKSETTSSPLPPSPPPCPPPATLPPARQYYSDFPGRYFSGDRARRDEEGYWWITGRTDDVINVSGHRLGTAEVEAAIMQTPGIAKAAVVGFEHAIKGTGIYAYVVQAASEDGASAPTEDELRLAVVKTVRGVIGPVASPDIVQVASALPETRSGKTMRRILRKVAENDIDDFGDTSTLLDPAVVDELVVGRLNK